MPESLTYAQLAPLLRVPFAEVDAAVLERMVALGEVVRYPTRATIIAQGEDADDVYLLVTGRLLVHYANRFGEVTHISEIEAGEFFGEMSLFTRDPRSTSVSAARISTVLRFGGAAFRELLDGSAALTKQLGATLIRRLSASNAGRERGPVAKNVVLAPIQGDYDLEALGRELVGRLGASARVLYVDRAVAEAQDFWRADATEAERARSLSRWLYAVERDYDYLLLRAEYGATAWSRLCLGQADRILLVGHRGGDPAASPLERELIGADHLAELTDVLLVLDERGGGAAGASAAAFAKTRDARYVVRLTADGDLDRLGRILSGTAVKLVLGGGGARGFAHLGVYRALREAGVPIDFVGGTSIGAVMAATIATDWDYDEMMAAARGSFVDTNPIKDYHLPFVSVFSAAKLERELERRFGDLEVADLRIPFFSVAANLTQMRTEILDEGLVRDALRASVSLPSVLPPHVHGNDLLLDGGIVDNLPYDHMETLARGPSIGVDLSFVKQRTLGYRRIPKSSRLLLSRFGGRKYKVPSIYQVMMGTMTLASNEKRIRNMDRFELYIRPEVAKFGFLKWGDFEAIVAEGYLAGREALAGWGG